MVYIKYYSKSDKTRKNFMFYEHHFALMQKNYKKSKCPITESGLIRYCSAYVPERGKLFIKCEPTAIQQKEFYRGVSKLLKLDFKNRKNENVRKT